MNDGDDGNNDVYITYTRSILILIIFLNLLMIFKIMNVEIFVEFFRLLKKVKLKKIKF